MVKTININTYTRNNARNVNLKKIQHSKMYKSFNNPRTNTKHKATHEENNLATVTYCHKCTNRKK